MELVAINMLSGNFAATGGLMEKSPNEVNMNFTTTNFHLSHAIIILHLKFIKSLFADL